MDVFLIFMLFFSIFLDVESIDTSCPAVKCSYDAPDIQFPFSVQGLQPQHCTHPGFGLVCRENKTMIQFPSYGDLVVKSISYDMRKLSLLDPKNCVHEVFLNLNLSLTPFRYYYVVKNYTYLNCSAQLSPSFMQVPCLSGSRYHVYVVESFQAVPASCKPVKTISIPFSYSPYLSDNSFGLGFTWDLPGRKDFRSGGGCSDSWIARCFNGTHGKAIVVGQTSSDSLMALDSTSLSHRSIAPIMLGLRSYLGTWKPSSMQNTPAPMCRKGAIRLRLQ